MFEVAEFCFDIDLQKLFKLYSKERQKAHSNSFNSRKYKKIEWTTILNANEI